MFKLFAGRADDEATVTFVLCAFSRRILLKLSYCLLIMGLVFIISKASLIAR